MNEYIDLSVKLRQSSVVYMHCWGIELFNYLGMKINQSFTIKFGHEYHIQ